MVELGEMAELVDDDVVGKCGRQEEELVAEIKIPLLRAAPPAGLLIANRDSLVCESVVCISVRESFVHKRTRSLPVREVVLGWSSYESKHDGCWNGIDLLPLPVMLYVGNHRRRMQHVEPKHARLET